MSPPKKKGAQTFLTQSLASLFSLNWPQKHEMHKPISFDGWWMFAKIANFAIRSYNLKSYHLSDILNVVATMYQNLTLHSLQKVYTKSRRQCVYMKTCFISNVNSVLVTDVKRHMGQTSALSTHPLKCVCCAERDNSYQEQNSNTNLKHRHRRNVTSHHSFLILWLFQLL